jgi:hypothetical protein
MGGDALYMVLWSERVVRWPKLSDDRPAAQWLTEQLTAGGLPIDGDPAGGSVATTWFGLPATARVLDEDLEDHRLLLPDQPLDHAFADLLPDNLFR